MEYHLRTKLNGNIAMTSCFHENSFLQRDRSLSLIPQHYYKIFFLST